MKSAHTLPSQFVCGRHYQTGEPLIITWQAGVISQIESLTEPQTDLPLIGPGLTDLQVNGFRGVDVNSDTLAVEDVEALTQSLWSCGVTSYLPTVITNSDSRIKTALQTIREACERFPMVKKSIAGIHLEGPFISPQDGPVGAHPKAYVKAPDWSLFEEFLNASGHQIRIVTVSPEWPESTDFIRNCVAAGVIVSIGHTAATSEQIRDAVAAGARLSTHLGNGSHLVLPRHPNYIWEQLAQDELTACVIADGFHLPDAVLKVIMRVKQGRTLLVSDSVGLAGCPPGQYSTHIGDNVVLTEEGKLHLAGKPNVLAGSAQPLIWGVQHLRQRQLSPLDTAWDMASVLPSRFLGLPQQQGLAIGAPADLVVFEQTNAELQILETYKAGQKVYQRQYQL
ncbi:N-acetylglucosamine-6-phosphate deacetylase [Spirosoma validum]|uniref:Amidohydrolase family protein n=1 Tax=Spirosoma validum TaxID=2771355 RepID=A0A927AX31_9BACT|nr:amidohydrolase family protein [Spirosoma validum]MBD2751416.1 amidohydrolase family protein [Spirosoma validum]